MVASSKRLVAGVVSLAVVLAYAPLLRAGWVWDDDNTLFDNPLIKAPDGLWRFWFTRQAPDYWPVTYSDLWIEWRLWGNHPLAFHLGAVGLHGLACLTLWAVLRRLAVPGALFAALLFAVHPVNVESVAWIADRKDLLATLFFLLSVLFALQPRYVLSLGAFALAMLSKGSAAPLPVILAGLVLYQHRRAGTTPRADSWLRLTPFFLISAGLAAANVWFETHRAGASARPGGMTDRVLGAAAAGWFYLGKALVPLKLAFIYPQWHVAAAQWRWWLPLIAAALITIGAGRALHQRRSPWSEGVGWAWFYFWAALAPVLGFANIYFMRYALVADHYQRLALVGVVAVEGAILGALWTRTAATRAAAVALVLAAAALTFRQCFNYRDAETLYRTTLAANPGAWLAHTNLGNLLATEGRLPEALREFDAALKLRPGDVETENDEGAALARLGRFEEAIGHYRAALAREPRSVQVNYNWGLALRDTGRPREAVPRLREALRWAPGFTEARNAEAACLLEAGDFAEAAALYQESAEEHPESAAARYGLGKARFGLGRPDEAVACYQEALARAPKAPDVLNDYGCALLKLNRLDEALAQFRLAEQVRPDLPELPYNLAVTLARLGRLDESVFEFRRELQARPDNTDAQRKLTAVQAALRERRGS